MEHRSLNKIRGTRHEEQNHLSCSFSFLVSRSSAAGFTFVETLVAISILLLAIAAPLSLGSQGLSASRVARDQVIATYLAQEAIEFARNIRDANTLAGNMWITDLEECIDGLCMLDIPAGEIEACPEKAGCDPLIFDEETGFYGLGGEDPGDGVVITKYTRSLYIDIEDQNSNEALLTATVEWQDGLATRSVTVEDSILDWQ